MVVPKKGSRKLVVDGVEFRWRIRWRNSAMTSTVELYENPQSVLSISFPWIPKKDFWDWYEVPAIITPKIIAICIKSALAKGWQPSEKGKVFKFNHENE